jgi:DNA-binding SARP family transcriptional activator
VTARRAEVVRGVAAAAVLAGVVIGVPVVLAAAVGWPLPGELPSVAELGEILTAERAPEAATVWKILAVLAWVAWAQVVASLVVETAATLRQGLAATLPGLGLAHGLTAPLVAAIVLAWPGGGAPSAAAASTPAVASPPPPPPAAELGPSPATTPPPSATVDHVVVRRDTLWDLAQRYLGDGRRARELFEANRGRPQPDGSTLTDPGLLRPGWVISIPVEADAVVTGAVEVRPGDTLWELAEEHLGDGQRYSELVELNAGRPQPDGDTLVDPDRIEPGWVLRLTSAGAAPAAPMEAPVAAPANGTVPPPVDPPPPVDTQVVPPGADHGDRGAVTLDEDGAGPPLAPVGLIGGGVATAGLVVLLDRRRRAQQRRRLRGHRPPQPGAAAAGAERVLRAGADYDGAARVDLALRAAAAGEDGLPALRWVEASPDAIVVVVGDHRAPPPGFVDDGPGRWRTGVGDVGDDELAALATPAASPAPCLVPVGRDDAGAEVLIDLEAAGVVSVVGDPEAATALVRAAAVAAATSPWSEGARVLAVGLDDVRLPTVEAVAAFGDALAAAERRVERTAVLAGGHPPSADGAGRREPVDAEPLMVLSAAVPNEDDRRTLCALASAPGSGVAVVMVVPGPAEAVGLVLSVDADGSVTVNDHRLRVRQLDEGAMASVDELLETAASPAVPPGDDQLKPPAPVIAGEHPVPPSGSALHELLREVDVLVRVLGPVEAVRLTPDGETRLRVGKQKSLEAITYLALRETPVDREELQAALWPAGTNSAKTFQNVVWAARKALGADRDGAELLPDPVDGRYGSNPRLVTDYGLFHELVTRAAETDDPTEAARLLADALRVVRGEPFVGVGRNYVWVAPHAGMVVAQVVDAAEELAEMRLAAGDCRGAEEAARAGLRVFPCEERLYRVLMRCAHASGSRAGVQRAFDELVARAADPDGGVEPEDTVHEDTIALLEELTRARPGSS